MAFGGCGWSLIYFTKTAGLGATGRTSGRSRCFRLVGGLLGQSLGWDLHKSLAVAMPLRPARGWARNPECLRACDGRSGSSIFSLVVVLLMCFSARCLAYWEFGLQRPSCAPDPKLEDPVPKPHNKRPWRDMSRNFGCRPLGWS